MLICQEAFAYTGVMSEFYVYASSFFGGEAN